MLSGNTIKGLAVVSPLTITNNGASHLTLEIAEPFLRQSYTNTEVHQLFIGVDNTGAVSTRIKHAANDDVMVLYNTKDIESMEGVFVYGDLSVIGPSSLFSQNIEVLGTTVLNNTVIADIDVWNGSGLTFKNNSTNLDIMRFCPSGSILITNAFIVHGKLNAANMFFCAGKVDGNSLTQLNPKGVSYTVSREPGFDTGVYNIFFRTTP